jgi:serine/threonine protein kinase
MVQMAMIKQEEDTVRRVSIAQTLPLAQDDQMATEGVQEDLDTASIDDFIRIKQIGEGAFGKVMLVRQKDTGTAFAMKMFNMKKIEEKTQREQQILKTTCHLFIVSLHYAFQGPSFWALVMEFCPNGDLQEYLTIYGDPGMSLPDIACMGGQIMLAVEHLHATNVIFRDLKLENVVLDQDWRAKITDFGFAKQLGSLEDGQTRRDSMCGSHGYTAPEILRNTGQYTNAVDLYSFGVMMYLMLSGGERRMSRADALPDHCQPPSKHSDLMRRIKEASRAEACWTQAEHGALEILNVLVSADPCQRTSASRVKCHHFFTSSLGMEVDALMTHQPECAGSRAVGRVVP